MTPFMDATIIDRLDGAKDRLTGLADILGAVNPAAMILTEDGVSGLWMIVDDVAATLRDLSSELTHKFTNE